MHRPIIHLLAHASATADATVATAVNINEDVAGTADAAVDLDATDHASITTGALLGLDAAAHASATAEASYHHYCC